MLRQFFLQRCDQLPVVIVDRNLAAELVVVFGDLQHTIAGDVFPAQNVLQEGHHVVSLFRTTERRDQDRVIFGGGSRRLHVVYRDPSFGFCNSASADNTSSLCLLGFTPVNTFATLPSGFTIKVCREENFTSPRFVSEP